MLNLFSPCSEEEILYKNNFFFSKNDIHTKYFNSEFGCTKDHNQFFSVLTKQMVICILMLFLLGSLMLQIWAMETGVIKSLYP